MILLEQIWLVKIIYLWGIHYRHSPLMSYSVRKTAPRAPSYPTVKSIKIHLCTCHLSVSAQFREWRRKFKCNGTSISTGTITQSKLSKFMKALAIVLAAHRMNGVRSVIPFALRDNIFVTFGVECPYFPFEHIRLWRHSKCLCAFYFRYVWRERERATQGILNEKHLLPSSECVEMCTSTLFPSEQKLNAFILFHFLPRITCVCANGQWIRFVSSSTSVKRSCSFDSVHKFIYVNSNNFTSQRIGSEE